MLQRAVLVHLAVTAWCCACLMKSYLRVSKDHTFLVIITYFISHWCAWDIRLNFYRLPAAFHLWVLNTDWLLMYTAVCIPLGLWDCPQVLVHLQELVMHTLCETLHSTARSTNIRLGLVSHSICEQTFSTRLLQLPCCTGIWRLCK